MLATASGLAGCITGGSIAGSPAGTPLLLQSNALFYPTTTNSVLRDIEQDVPITGLFGQSRLRGLLTGAGQDRVDWTIICDVAAVDRLQNCRVTDLYPDRADLRDEITRSLPNVRITAPTKRNGQQAESFVVGVRVTTKVNRISMSEPCAAAFFCPIVHTTQPRRIN